MFEKKMSAKKYWQCYYGEYLFSNHFICMNMRACINNNNNNGYGTESTEFGAPNHPYKIDEYNVRFHETPKNWWEV